MMSTAPPDATPPAESDQAALPLYIDLDGTLTPVDTLQESLVALVRRNLAYVALCLLWLFQGRASFKREVAERVLPDPQSLPLREDLLAYLRGEHARGRTLVLATAAEERVATCIASHLGIFSGVLATRTENLRGALKLQAIQTHARGRFVYAGNSEQDLAVWRGSDGAIAVAPSAGVRRRLLAMHPDARIFEPHSSAWRMLLQAMRPTQWSKNLLVLLPLMAGHVTDAHAWLLAILTFVAFGLCASASYLFNDLLDLAADRVHPHKRSRPIASGRLSVARAALAATSSAAAGLLLALSVSGSVAAMLAGYLAIATLYSSYLKSVAIVDVLVLAILYAWRVLTGAVACGVIPSNWLMAFALFLFLSLALVKRCAELERMSREDGARSPGRGYLAADLPTLRAMGMASGFLAVMVLTLYIDSQNGKAMYPSHEWLWGLAPLMLGWMMRIWLKVARGDLTREDPVAFVLTDRYSWFTLAAMGGCVLAASQSAVRA